MSTFGSVALTKQMFHIARAYGRTTLLDLEAADILHADNSGVIQVLGMTDILFCSEAALGATQELLKHHDVAPNLIRGRECSIITRGAKGARLISEDAQLEAQGHDSVSMDTTGAGDCFVAAFLAARNEGKPLVICLTLANSAGAIATLEIRAQTASPSLEKVHHFLRSHPKWISIANTKG